MGAALDQVDTADLWKSTGPAPGREATESAIVGRGIWDIFNRTIQGHKAVTEEKGSDCFCGRAGMTTRFKQSDQRAWTQLIAPIGHRRLSWHIIFWVRPDVAQPLRQFAQDMTHRTLAIQVHGNQYPDCDHHVQFALTLFHGIVLTQYGLNTFRGDDPLEEIEAE